MTLSGKRVVIVGGTSGIGFAVAQAALAQGAHVAVASSQAGNVEKAVQRLGAGATGFTINVTDEADVERAFGTLGPFDHLVFTAGDWAARDGGRLPRLISPPPRRSSAYASGAHCAW